MVAESDFSHGHDVIKQFVETEGSVVVSQKTVPENIAEMRRCLIKGVIFSDLAVIPSGLDTTAIAEYMYQGLNE